MVLGSQWPSWDQEVWPHQATTMLWGWSGETSGGVSIHKTVVTEECGFSFFLDIWIIGFWIQYSSLFQTRIKQIVYSEKNTKAIHMCGRHLQKVCFVAVHVLYLSLFLPHARPFLFNIFAWHPQRRKIYQEIVRKGKEERMRPKRK